MKDKSYSTSLSTDKRKPVISFNSPVIIVFAAICTLALILSYITRGASNSLLFSVYRSRMSFFAVIRTVGHVFGHADLSHFMGNMMLFLILGPMLEEKYGSRDLVIVILITALITGVLHIIFKPGAALLGASGVVFAFILLSSFTGNDKGKIPVTFILVALLYFGQQIYELVAVKSNVSNFTHIVGGVIGAAYGFLSKKMSEKR